MLGMQVNDKGRAFVSQDLKIKSNFGSSCRRGMHLLSLSWGCGVAEGGAAVIAELPTGRT